MENVIQSKRFVVRQSLVGQNKTINVELKNGKTVTYNHDKVFEIILRVLPEESVLSSGVWLQMLSQHRRK